MQVKEVSLTLNPVPSFFNHEDHEEKLTKNTKQVKVEEGRALSRPSCKSSQLRMRN
jgi:hypothetical protein